jgi:hypothetical protein
LKVKFPLIVPSLLSVPPLASVTLLFVVSEAPDATESVPRIVLAVLKVAAPVPSTLKLVGLLASVVPKPDASSFNPKVPVNARVAPAAYVGISSLETSPYHQLFAINSHPN